jgi:hypothetical protein
MPGYHRPIGKTLIRKNQNKYLDRQMVLPQKSVLELYHYPRKAYLKLLYLMQSKHGL